MTSAFPFPSPEPVDRLRPMPGDPFAEPCPRCLADGRLSCVACLGEPDTAACGACGGRTVVACFACGGSLRRVAFARWCAEAMRALMPAEVRAAVQAVDRVQTEIAEVEHRNAGGVFRVTVLRGRGDSLAAHGFKRAATREGSRFEHWFWLAPRAAWWAELHRLQDAEAPRAGGGA